MNESQAEEFNAQWNDTKCVPARLVDFLLERATTEFKVAQKLEKTKRELEAHAEDAKKSRLAADEKIGEAVLEDARRKANNESPLERASALTQDLVTARPAVKAPPKSMPVWALPKSKAPHSDSPNAAPFVPSKRARLPTPTTAPTNIFEAIVFGMSSA